MNQLLSDFWQMSVMTDRKRFKKFNLWGLQLFVLGAILSNPTVNLAAPIIPYPLIAQQQFSNHSQASIQVALPDFVVISLNTGTITSGDFISLNEQTLIIAISGYLQGIPLSDIKTVVFKNGVLIPENSNTICQVSSPECHKIQTVEISADQQQTWPDIPLTAFTLPQGSKTAWLKLQENLAEEDWQSVTEQSNNMIYVIEEIAIQEEGNQMTITASPTNRRK